MRAPLLVTTLTLATSLALASGCARTSPAADAELAQATPWLFANFEGDATEIAEVLRAIEDKTYLTVELDGNEVDRSFEQDMLTLEQLSDIEHPNAGLDGMVGMSVAYLSGFEGGPHAEIVMMDSQVPVEPYSPDKYDRTFVEGESCWLDRGCETIRTENDLIKKNFLMEVPYVFFKDFRWIDISEGDDPRWAVIARSYMKESATGEGGDATIVQSYSIEYTIPRDGRGFRLDDAPEGSEIAVDSQGEGTLRLQSLWTETRFESISVGEDLVKGTVRGGIDKNYDAADDFLAEQAEE